MLRAGTDAAFWCEARTLEGCAAEKDSPCMEPEPIVEANGDPAPVVEETGAAEPAPPEEPAPVAAAVTAAPAVAASAPAEDAGAAAARKFVVAEKVERSCAMCGTETASLQSCGACKRVWYCGKECQASHWPEHYPQCAAFAQQAEREAGGAVGAKSIASPAAAILMGGTEEEKKLEVEAVIAQAHAATANAVLQQVAPAMVSMASGGQEPQQQYVAYYVDPESGQQQPYIFQQPHQAAQASSSSGNAVVAYNPTDQQQQQPAILLPPGGLEPKAPQKPVYVSCRGCGQVRQDVEGRRWVHNHRQGGSNKQFVCNRVLCACVPPMICPTKGQPHDPAMVAAPNSGEDCPVADPPTAVAVAVEMADAMDADVESPPAAAFSTDDPSEPTVATATIPTAQATVPAAAYYSQAVALPGYGAVPATQQFVQFNPVPAAADPKQVPVLVCCRGCGLVRADYIGRRWVHNHRQGKGNKQYACNQLLCGCQKGQICPNKGKPHDPNMVADPASFPANMASAAPLDADTVAAAAAGPVVAQAEAIAGGLEAGELGGVAVAQATVQSVSQPGMQMMQMPGGMMMPMGYGMMPQPPPKKKRKKKEPIVLPADAIAAATAAAAAAAAAAASAAQVQLLPLATAAEYSQALPIASAADYSQVLPEAQAAGPMELAPQSAATSQPQVASFTIGGSMAIGGGSEQSVYDTLTRLGVS